MDTSHSACQTEIAALKANWTEAEQQRRVAEDDNIQLRKRIEDQGITLNAIIADLRGQVEMLKNNAEGR